MGDLKGRLQRGLDGRPLTWLAEQTGDAYKNVQRWVSGSTTPPPDFLARYVEATDVDGHWLITGTGPMRRTDPGRERETLEGIRRMLEELEG